MDRIVTDSQLTDDQLPVVNKRIVNEGLGVQQQMMRHGSDLAGVCPYLRSNATPADLSSGLQDACHASPNHFVPSNVHLSSCCLNPANFIRCPYYLGAMGKEKRQIDFQLRKRSAIVRLRDQLVRLLSFRRNPRRKRRRIYIISL